MDATIRLYGPGGLGHSNPHDKLVVEEKRIALKNMVMDLGM